MFTNNSNGQFYYGNGFTSGGGGNYFQQSYSFCYQCGSCGQQYPVNTIHVCPVIAVAAQNMKEENMGSTPVASSYTQAIEIIYRFGNERVKTALIKGVSDEARAEELFLAQFGDEDDEDVKRPEIIAAVEVLVAA